MIIGGSIAVGTGFLFAVFPQLYEIDGRPFDAYIHEDRGVPNTRGNLQPWAPSGAKPTMEIVNCIIKCTLGIMYHMICKPQQNPMAQIRRRFSALYSTVKPGVQPPVVDIDPTFDLKAAASWLSSKGLDTIILGSLLNMENHSTVGPTRKAFIAQINLISSYAEMTPLL
uniref:Uncharacterized protein n=1 Tax=Myotis myotis TaxID=51298 RepID=A0A7J7UCT7_MYOMY|nr:hypothetical protein mMyoMyo1_008738 [Myotis myotis]